VDKIPTTGINIVIDPPGKFKNKSQTLVLMHI